MAYVMAAAKGGSRSALGHARYFGGRGVGGLTNNIPHHADGPLSESIIGLDLLGLEDWAISTHTQLFNGALHCILRQ
jgi:hypothetical protein